MLPSLRWVSSTEQFWLTALFALCCLPGILFVGGHSLRIPVMPIWGAGYFMLFGTPFFGNGEQEVLSSMPSDMVLAALRLVVLGAFCCLLAFYTPLGLWIDSILPSLRTPWDVKRAPQSGVILCLIGVVMHYLALVSPPSPALRQIFSILAMSSALGMLTLFLLQLRGMLSWRLKFFLWGAVFPAEYLFGLGTGSVYNAVIVLSPFLFCYTAERRRIPILQALILLGVLIIPFLGFKAEYRSYAWSSGENVDTALRASSPLQKGLFFINLVTQRLTEGGVEAYTVAVETSQERASHTGLLAMVMDMTPQIIPYWKGETYSTLLWLFVPRILYPGKPTKTLGQEFGHRYEIISEEDEWTSVNLPHQVVEMYINFGTTGVVLGMFLIGCLYRAIAVFLGRPASGERALLIGCTLCAVLLNLDSDFSLVFGGVVYCLAVLYLVSHVFHGRVSPSSKIPAPTP